MEFNKNYNANLRADGNSSAPQGALISGKDSLGNQQDVLVGTDGKLQIDASFSPSGTQDVNVKQYNGSTVGAGNAVHVQPGTSAVFQVGDNSASLTVDGTVAATQSGTWTVQPGNTANTTAWKVDGSAVTQPVSIASLPLGAAATALASFQSTAPTVTATALSTHTSNSVTVKSLGSNTDDIYIGGTGVTTSTGFPLSPGDTWTDRISNTNLIFAISATAGQVLAVTYTT